MFTIKSYHGLSEAGYNIINCRSKSTVGNDIIQLGELINLYRVASSNDLEENLNFHIAKNIFIDVDTEKLNNILSSSKYI